MKVGCPRGGIRLVMHNLRTLHNRGSAADEADANGEQQLKQTWLWMGKSWVWPRETSARQRRYRTRAVGASDYGATCRCGEGGGTSEEYLCMQWREDSCAPPCANVNGGESSSDLHTMKRATCRCWTAHVGERGGSSWREQSYLYLYIYCQSSSPVVQSSVYRLPHNPWFSMLTMLACFLWLCYRHWSLFQKDNGLTYENEYRLLHPCSYSFAQHSTFTLEVFPTGHFVH